MFLLMSGVWDDKMKRRVVGFLGLLTLLGVGYIGALMSGVTTLRLFL